MKFHALSVILMASVLGACVTDEEPSYYTSGGYYQQSRPVVVEDRYYRDNRGPRYTPAPVYDRYRPAPPRYEGRGQWRNDAPRPPRWREDDRRRPDWRGDDRRPSYGRDNDRGRPDWRNDNRRPDRDESRRPDRRPDTRPERPNPRRDEEMRKQGSGGGFSLRQVPQRNAPQNEPEVIMAPNQGRR